MAKARININTQGIKEAIKALIEKNIIVEQSKIVSKDVLSNKNRNRIYGCVESNPGGYFLKIVRDTELSIPVVSWHLNILEKFGFIRKEKQGGNRIYYCTDISSNDAKLIGFLSKKKSKKIINLFLNKTKSLSVNKISKELSIHSTTIKKYINTLMEFKLIKREKSSYYFTYTLNKGHFFQIIDNFSNLDDISPWLENFPDIQNLTEVKEVT